MKVSNPRLSRVKARHVCHACELRRLLLKAGCGDNQLPESAATICSRGPYAPGDRIYRHGDPFNTLFAVTTGSVKTEQVSRNGSLQVSGFYLRGDLFGAEALGEDNHINDAVALEESWVCELRVSELMKLCQQHKEVLQGLFQLLGRRTRCAHLHQINQRGHSSEQRVLGFLQDFAEHSSKRLNGSGDGKKTMLPMNKEDIASYLAIAPESLSRVLKRLEESGIIRNSAHAYEIISGEK